jgi:hypothetical protein
MFVADYTGWTIGPQTYRNSRFIVSPFGFSSASETSSHADIWKVQIAGGMPAQNQRSQSQVHE